MSPWWSPTSSSPLSGPGPATASPLPPGGGGASKAARRPRPPTRDGEQALPQLVGPDYVLVWLSRGDGSFDVRYFRPWEGYGLNAGSWQSGDFNGDGKQDLLHLAGAD